VIRQDFLEKQVKLSYLAIGSNIGDRLANIQLAKKFLVLNNIYIEDTSSYYETPSWPNRRFPKFFNIVIKIKTDMSLINLFKIIKNIEKKVGRKNALKNHPRICDIDIIDFNGINLKTEFSGQKIEIPHPKMHKRNFVIFPLYELNKNWVHPKTKVNINHIINQFKDLDLSDIRIV
tara:strand:+ start:1244 stop:1771 length:528 start_codon:yes stop_codon:yes gene_type:complete